MTTTKRSTMTLYSGISDIYSHWVRIVLAEKGVSVDIIYVDPINPPQDLLDINPYSKTPTLIDRDLVLDEPDVILEYLDERFPHPPLLPVYPIARAKSRLMMHKIAQDWISQAIAIETGKKTGVQAAHKNLSEQLMGVSPLFAELPYFLSEDFSLVDCYIAPLLWRLPKYDINLLEKSEPIRKYARKVFQRSSFQSSLSDEEFELTEKHDL